MTDDHPVLVDSNVFIDSLRRGADPMAELHERYPATDLVTCGVVKAEVLRGVRSLRARERLEGLFDVMRYVQTSQRLWDEALQLAWTLDREGRIIPLTDIVIASCAIHEGAIVLTSERHFDLVPGLQIQRP